MTRQTPKGKPFSQASLTALDHSATRRFDTTVMRVRAAIESLLSQQLPVSLHSISWETWRLNPESPPVAPSTIRRNPDAAALYYSFRTTRQNDRGFGGNRRLAKMMRHSKHDLVIALMQSREQLLDFEAQLADLAEENIALRQSVR